MRYLCWEVTVCQVLGIISLKPHGSSVLHVETEAQRGQAVGLKSHSEAIQEETGTLVPQHIKGIPQTCAFLALSPSTKRTHLALSCALLSLPDGSLIARPQAYASTYNPPPPPTHDVSCGASVGTPGPGSEVLVGLSWVHPEAWWARPALGLPDLPLRLLCWRG